MYELQCQYQHIPGGYIFHFSYAFKIILFIVWVNFLNLNFKMLHCFSFCYIWYFILWLTVYVLVHFYSSKQRKWKMNQCTSEDQWNKQGIMFQCFYLKHKIFNNCLLSLWCLIRKIIGVDIHYEHCNNKRIFYWSTGVMFQYLIVNKT